MRPPAALCRLFFSLEYVEGLATNTKALELSG
jgi:hypothetical protein